MKTASFAILLFTVVLCHSVVQGTEIPTRFRRLYNDKVIKSRKNDFGEKVGIPLVYNAAKKSFTETKNAGTDAAEKEAEQEPADDDESMQAMRDEGVEKLKQDSKDDDDDDEERQENNGKNKEEMGSGYDDIGDMGSGRGEDNDEEKEESQHHKGASKSSKQGEMAGEKEISQSSDEIPDLSGEFPPDADQASKLPEDPKTTPEEVDRELLDKHKGYFQFTIRQRFKPEFKYKESPAYRILSGNVIEDVERALKATGVVKEVLFREAKNVGGPPYRSKVKVYMKTIKVNPKRMKKIINYGLINGMITVPGSFHTT